jgi:two-component system, LytTR family, sensor kinase
MKYSLKTIDNWKLAALISAVLSLFGVITNTRFSSDFNIILLVPSWLLTFSFLLVSWYLNSRITNHFFSDHKKWKLINQILVIVFSNILLLFFFIVLSFFISKTFHLERESNYIYIAVRGITSVAIIFLVQFTLNLNTRNQTVLLQNEMLKTENIRTQFEMLRQQISPHFLFNSLSSLRSMIRSADKNSETFVIKLSDIYRQLLANKEIHTITLKKELEFIEDYLFLLFTRYENKLSIQIDISESHLGFKIPTFALQLLLENCVKHNVVSKENPLKIRIYDSGVQMISIENNLLRKVNVVEESGIGLQNLIKRYHLLGITNGVQIYCDESVYRVKIKLLDS